jgi:elongation factor 1-alpha
MSYRLDEGNGLCIYKIGVEDDGCHSLLDYTSVAESARILECIARSLNSVVMERTMIQNEVMDDTDGNPIPITESSPIIVQEPPTWSLSGAAGTIQNAIPDDDITNTISNSQQQQQQQRQKLRKGLDQNGQGVYTRAEIVIHRIETHLLDPSPISLEELAQSVDAMSLREPPIISLSPKHNSNTSSSKNHPNNNSTSMESSNENDGDGSNNQFHDKNKAAENLSIGETLSSRNIRIAVVGNVDAGKSTLIGTLTTSCLDDGRGKSRTSIMKHRHEIESGRTSTATTHLMGFRSTGEPIAGRDQVRAMKRKSEDEIARESYRVITLMDLAGHEKYLKTTIHGVSSGFADHALILVNARHPPTHMTQHHLNLCCSFGIPVIVLFTKIDGCPEHAFKISKEGVIKMLRSPEVQRTPYTVKNEQDIAMVIDKLHTLAPMIETSCVSGEGIELLQKLLFSLPKRRRHENKANRSFEFLVEDIFNVPGVGAVVSGFVNAGELTVGSNVFVGPTDDGTFMRTVAKSAHIARINTSHVTSGQSACLAFALNKELRKKLRRGMVVLKENPTSTLQFDAEICVLKGEGTTIRRSYQAYVHILNVRQSAFARNIEIVNNHAVGIPTSHSTSRGDKEGEEDCIVLRPGSRAKVTFEFAKRPEYIRPGMRMLFRDGRVRGVGIITSIPAAGIAKG